MQDNISSDAATEKDNAATIQSSANVSGSTSPAIQSSGERSHLALIILTTITVVFTLQWAKAFFIPLVLGILLAYALNPLVFWLEKVKIPRLIGTVIVMVTILGGLLLTTYSLRGQFQAIIDELPSTATKLSEAFVNFRGEQFIDMKKMQSIARQIENVTNQVAGVPPKPKERVTHVVIDTPMFKMSDFLWKGSMGIIGMLGQAVTVIFLVFFLLAAGDTFKRKLVRLTGPSLSKKKITVIMLDDINNAIQSYIFMLFTTNLLVALLSWIAFRLCGLENAGTWGIAAGVFHLIPYIGSLLVMIAVGVAAFVQFDSFSMSLIVATITLIISTIVGTFVTTWMTGKISRMNAVAIFVSMLFWGWCWGIIGMLISIPIVVITKVIAGYFERLHPIAELLGAE